MMSSASFIRSFSAAQRAQACVKSDGRDRTKKAGKDENVKLLKTSGNLDEFRRF
jgi:hypothetical protein